VQPPHDGNVPPCGGKLALEDSAPLPE